MYKVYTSGKFDYNLKCVSKYIEVSKVENKEFLYFGRYHYKVNVSSKLGRRAIISFSVQLIEYSILALLKHDYQTYIYCSSFGRHFLKALI